MAKKKKEEVVEQATEEPKVDNKVEKIKVKKPMKKFSEPEDGIVKVDLKELAKKAKDIVKVDINQQDPEKTASEETLVLEEIKDEGEKTEEVAEVAEVAEKEIVESIETEKELPENIQKLVSFMEDTGGDVNDYVSLNKDYSEMDNQTLLKEYYKTTKPHLSEEERDFLMDDQFSYNEEGDDEKDIKRKKLALKEQVASAKDHLDGLKSKYYEDIKMGSKLTSEQKNAIDFFNRYNQESEAEKKAMKRAKSTFLNKTENVFDKNFKGFEYKVGDKRYRFNVKDTDQVKDTQSDINNFVKKFLNKDNLMEDAKGYHKSLFTAMNSDAIANHFYEQGKADALKESVAKSKNIDMDPRQEHGNIVESGGIKVRALGDNSSDFKLKIKKRK